MMESSIFIMFKVILIALSLFPSDVRSGKLLVNAVQDEVILDFTLDEEDLGQEESGDSYYLTSSEDSKVEVLSFQFSDNGLYKISLSSSQTDEPEDIVELDVSYILSEMDKYKDQIGKEIVNIITSDGFEIVITPQDGKLIVSNSDVELSITLTME